MIRKLTLAIVTCPTSSILIQNHSAFREYFANKRQRKASLSLDSSRKRAGTVCNGRKKFADRKKFAIECCLPVTFPLLTYITQKFGQISKNSDFRSHSHCSVLLWEEPIKLEIEMPLSQIFSRRPTADKEPEKLWARREWWTWAWALRKFTRALRPSWRHSSTIPRDFRLQTNQLSSRGLKIREKEKKPEET